MKKQYIAPELSIELLEAVQTILWGSPDKPEPGAPKRQGDGSSVKLTKMYI